VTSNEGCHPAAPVTEGFLRSVLRGNFPTDNSTDDENEIAGPQCSSVVNGRMTSKPELILKSW